MIKRYEDVNIADIWSDEHKLSLWERTELKVLEALVMLQKLALDIFKVIKTALSAHPIDLEWWRQRDKEIGHDLMAFLEERLRFIPKSLQQYFHRKLTSYDTQEPAFATMLQESVAVVSSSFPDLLSVLENMALRYQYTIMRARSHGQGEELQTFGKRCLTWLRELQKARGFLDSVADDLDYSKLSGAAGNYGTLDPELEKKALELLGLLPYYGATQIMPRSLYVPLAAALVNISLILEKIANDIRLGARSPRPIYQEHFAPWQKGSSAMPDKRNPINCEQVEGLARMALGYGLMLFRNVVTDEERAIEQSCVERVAWPDLFHVVLRGIKVMFKVLSGLEVYPDNMLWEIHESRGCYASSDAKEFLKEILGSLGFDAEDCYRMVQVAAFNLAEVKKERQEMRERPASSLQEAEQLLETISGLADGQSVTLREIIMQGKLRHTPKLAITEEQIATWNHSLLQVFQNTTVQAEWNALFRPSVLLKNEEVLYREILGA